MRVEYNGAVSTINKNEIKGSDTVAVGESSVKKNALLTDTPYQINAATVEKALFSLESELARIKEDASQIDVSLIKKHMAVLSQTVSGEDLKGLSKEGYSLNGTPVKTIVTVMDKIKLALAKGGMDISVFGDDLSMEQLEAITGNAGMARQMAADLKDLSRDEVSYLVGRELPPTVENLYTAQHSGGALGGQKQQAVPEDENLKKQMEQVIAKAGLPVNETTRGYGEMLMAQEIPVTAENLKYVDELSNLKLPLPAQEIEKSIATAVSEGREPGEAYLLEGYSLKERAVQAQEVVSKTKEAELRAVVESGKPLTIEFLKEAGRQMPEAAQAESETAVSSGLTGKAEGNEVVQPVAKASVSGQLAGETEARLLTARRQLEEIRLAMTVEANYHLLKQGISIETLELSQLVEELKSIEENYYQTLLNQQGVPNAKESAAVFRETMDTAQALKGVPAYPIARLSLGETTMAALYQEGGRLKAQMEAANEAYETMMTTPRRDLGDSIQKAFSNVNDILADLGMEATPANHRAVRILAYNQMEITPRSIARVKAADETMQNLFANLKPGVVLEMIREGIHPLQTDVASLNERAEEIARSLDPGREEKYSKFLWELEQRDGISQQEKESFVGIYRLLRQIEKTDGAVIGAILHQGSELSLKNLLSAARSRKNAGIDVKVTEEFGAKETVTEAENAIHRQIDAAYQTGCAKEAFHSLTEAGLEEVLREPGWQNMTPEQLLWKLKEAEATQSQGQQLRESYAGHERELFQQAAATEEKVLQMLADYSLPQDSYHMLAMSAMVNERNGIFKKLFDPKNQEQTPDLSQIKEAVLKEFAESLKTPEDMAKAQQALAETAEHIMEGMINEEHISSLDVRMLKVLRTQLQLAGHMSREEHYAIPVMIADELTNVQLKIVRGKKTRGMVDIFFETARLGRVAARIQMADKRTEVFTAAEKPETLALLREQEQALSEAFAGEDGAVRFDFVQSETVNADMRRPKAKADEETKPNGQEYQVQTRRLYDAARTFLELVKGLA